MAMLSHDMGFHLGFHRLSKSPSWIRNAGLRSMVWAVGPRGMAANPSMTELLNNRLSDIARHPAPNCS